MNRRVRLLASLLFLACCTAPAWTAPAAPLERGTAITDPSALRELDHGRFALARIMAPARGTDAPLTDAQYFALPSMAPVRAALDAEFEKYTANLKAESPDAKIGVDDGNDFQLFD